MARETSAVHLAFHANECLWLNAVDVWFSQLERRAIHHGVFTSVKELRSEIHRYIKVHNAKIAKPFKWTKSANAIIESANRAKAQINQKD